MVRTRHAQHRTARPCSPSRPHYYGPGRGRLGPTGFSGEREATPNRCPQLSHGDVECDPPPRGAVRCPASPTDNHCQRRRRSINSQRARDVPRRRPDALRTPWTPDPTLDRQRSLPSSPRNQACSITCNGAPRARRRWPRRCSGTTSRSQGLEPRQARSGGPGALRLIAIGGRSAKAISPPLPCRSGERIPQAFGHERIPGDANSQRTSYAPASLSRESGPARTSIRPYTQSRVRRTAFSDTDAQSPTGSATSPPPSSSAAFPARSTRR